MSQETRAKVFHDLHSDETLLVLTNVWDVGSALAVQHSGAKALATGSWSVAAAQGYADGEQLPFDQLIATTRNIASRTQLPLSVDIETGYAEDLSSLAESIARIIEAGAIGVNIEDQVIGGETLRGIDQQAQRLQAIREKSNGLGVSLFINARTDVFLREPNQEAHAELFGAAVERGRAYAEAGASGFFVPGLTDAQLISQMAADLSLPLNVMVADTPIDVARWQAAGVKRISAGPNPYRRAMAGLTAEAAEANGS